MTTETYTDRTIRDYLLGQLSESESERLDELSITDNEYAERIRAVEYDLVDAFARGDLSGVVLEQFRSTYLTSPPRREMTRFAEALKAVDDNSGWAGLSEAGPGRTSVRETRPWRELLAIAAAVILAIGSLWVALDNRTLRERLTSAETQLEQELREAEARRAADIARLEPRQAPSPLTVATLVLTPQLRSGRQLPTVALAGGTGNLTVQLDLEPVDYPTYEAALVASSGDRIVWRSEQLIARAVGDRKRIDLGLPATVLSPQEYLIRVSGVPARGAAEIVGEYRFIVVR